MFGSSLLSSREPIIDDSTWGMFTTPPPQETGGEFGRGYIPRDYILDPFGSVAKPFDIPVIPREEWKERIEEMEAKDMLLSTEILRQGIPSSDQDGTNYCWCHGVKTAIYAVRAFQNQPFIDLSAASGAAQIKGYRNNGGWGVEALKFIIRQGIAPTSLWPENYWKDDRYLTEQCKIAMLENRISEWWELQDRNLDQIMTCLFYHIPVPVGFNWWRHEVCAFDPVYVNGQFGYRIRNSWRDTWGEKGFGLILGDRAYADDAVAPTVVYANAA